MKPIRHITLKSRQVGLSTLWILFWLDDTLFRQGVITGIMAHELDSLQHLASIVKFAISNFVFPIKLSEDNQKRISFEYNDSTILIDLEFRSTPLHNLHISEWAFCENERIWATLAATSKAANITGESTGHGLGNDFYLTWMDAKENKNEYRHRFIPWFENQEYKLPLNGVSAYLPDTREKKFLLDEEQIHFRRQMMSKLKSDFFIEYPETEEDSFGMAGNMFFNSKKVITLVREARELALKEPPVTETDKYTIWELPKYKHQYAIGADTAEGLENDYSTFKVLCLNCRQEAMSYRSHVGIDTFYKDLNDWGKSYNNALLGVERNNHGHAVLLGLRETCNYQNLYKEDIPEQPIIVNLNKKRPEPKYGWHTTAITKPLMLDHLKLALEGDSEEDENTFRPDLIFKDLTFLSECLTLERVGSKLQAISGKHDDMVMATAIAYQMLLKLRSKKSVLSDSLEKVVLGAKREVPI